MERLISQPALSLLEIARIGNEKLLAAAIDLAIFTPTGINADKIGMWAHRCEKLEKANAPTPELLAIAEDVRKAIILVCEVGRSLWATSNRRFLFDLPEAFAQPLIAQEAQQRLHSLKKAA